MNGYLLLILLVFLLAAITAWTWWQKGRIPYRSLPRPFRERPSSEETWKQACHDETISEADTCLQMLCEAFSFDPDDRYRFAPNDRIVDVYQACYPRWQIWNIGDCMEIESLMMDLQRRFQLDDVEISEMTIIEIAGLMKSSLRSQES